MLHVKRIGIKARTGAHARRSRCAPSAATAHAANDRWAKCRWRNLSAAATATSADRGYGGRRLTGGSARERRLWGRTLPPEARGEPSPILAQKNGAGHPAPRGSRPTQTTLPQAWKSEHISSLDIFNH